MSLLTLGMPLSSFVRLHSPSMIMRKSFLQTAMLITLWMDAVLLIFGIPSQDSTQPKTNLLSEFIPIFHSKSIIALFQNYSLTLSQ